MEYSINKLCQLAGVTSRTLRYYDAIGLLKPSRINSSGYRIYGETEVSRLQQILFFRELELPLEDIKSLLDDPDFDNEQAFKRHKQQLLAKRERLDQLLATLDKTIQHQKGESHMTDREKFEGFKRKVLAENEAKYGTEIREKYGKDTIGKSNKQFANLTPEQYQAMQEMASQIITDLAEAMKTNDPASEKGQAVAALHKKWLTYTWPSYSKEAHRGLAEMYVMDERFTKYYDGPAGEGAAEFLRNAVHIFAAE